MKGEQVCISNLEREREWENERKRDMWIYYSSIAREKSTLWLLSREFLGEEVLKVKEGDVLWETKQLKPHRSINLGGASVGLLLMMIWPKDIFEPLP